MLHILIDSPKKTSEQQDPFQEVSENQNFWKLWCLIIEWLVGLLITLFQLLNRKKTKLKTKCQDLLKNNHFTKLYKSLH